MTDPQTFQVSLQRLSQLLAEGGEGPRLDFKETLDLDKKHDLVEFAKDVAAFGAEGGHIVVGIDDEGQPSDRFDHQLAKKFDDANLRQKLEKYLSPPIAVRTAVHEHEGHVVVLVHIAPSPDGITVICGEGAYTWPDGKPNRVFQPGDVFVRDGTRSKRWGQHDVRALAQRLAELKKEEWLRAHRDDFVTLLSASTASQLAKGPATALTWTLDAATFEDVVIELLRANDMIPIRILLEKVVSEAIEYVRSTAKAAFGFRGGGSSSNIDEHAEASQEEDYFTILDRLVTLVALGLRLEHPACRDRAIGALHTIYERLAGLVRDGRQYFASAHAAKYWLAIGLRVALLGGLAVRQKSWQSVRSLAVRQLVDPRYETVTQYWLRHALTQGSRANLLGNERGERRGPSWIEQAMGLAERIPAIGRDVPIDDPGFVTSLVQFDLLAAAAVLGHGGGTGMRDWYPNFASASSHQVEPAALLLLNDQDVRRELFPRDDAALAELLRKLDEGARQCVPWIAFWDGWESKEIKDLLKKHPSSNA